jgi:hypothetical protein
MPVKDSIVHQPDQIKGYRVVILPLIAVLLIPIPVIFSHLNQPRDYAGLGVYVIVVMGLGYSAVFPPEKIYRRVVGPIRWLQRRWVLLVIALWVLLEVWYLPQDYIATFRGYEKSLLLVTWTALLVWMALVLLFAGRSREAIKRLGGNLLIGGTSLLVSICALGLGLAMTDYGSYQKAHQNWWESFEPDPLLGWRHPPDTRLGPVSHPSVGDEVEGEIYYYTDDFGLRNNGPRVGAPVAAVGDSFTFGVFVAYEDTWVYQVGEQLGVRTANYATSAYSLWQYNAALREHICHEDHQIVLYAVYANDLQNTLGAEEYGKSYYRNARLYRYRTPIDYGFTLVFERSPARHLIAFVQGMGAAEDEGGSPIESQAADLDRRTAPNGLQLVPFNNGVRMDYFETTAWAVEEQVVTGIELAHNCDLQFVLVPIPPREAVYADTFRALYPEPGMDEEIQAVEEAYRRLCEIAESQGAFCYNMLDDLRTLADPDGEPLYFKVDGHLNAHGNRAAADLIAAYLQERNIIDRE